MLLFFNRPDTLRMVFEAVKAARPRELFLVQDGPRPGRPTDEARVAECRDVVADVDWDCVVRTNYAEQNMGLGRRMFTGVSWAFEHVDRLCILEDDCVPGPDFFPFCEELLERYAHDTRVDMISGMNNLGRWQHTPYSYLFSTEGSIWGWATWKRAWETIDYDMSFLEDEHAMRLLSSNLSRRRFRQFRRHGRSLRRRLAAGQPLSTWTFQRGMNMYLHSGLIVVPNVNLVSNIGLTAESTHAVDSMSKLPRSIRPLFHMRAESLQWPLRHPPHVIRDGDFDQQLMRLMDPGYVRTQARRAESWVRRHVLATGPMRGNAG